MIEVKDGRIVQKDPGPPKKDDAVILWLMGIVMVAVLAMFAYTTVRGLWEMENAGPLILFLLMGAALVYVHHLRDKEENRRRWAEEELKRIRKGKR